MFNFFKSAKAVSMSPAEAHSKLSRGEITLIDVREPGECAKLRIPGAVNMPLSDLDTHLKSLETDKPVVFHCHSGKRSGMAVSRCHAQGKPHDTHVAGGILAWLAAGLPVER